MIEFLLAFVSGALFILLLAGAFCGFFILLGVGFVISKKTVDNLLILWR